MRKTFLYASLILASVSLPLLTHAVKPPSVQERAKAEAGREKDIKEKAKEQRATGCTYGKDVETGKCYEPKEGQFYRDPKTGEIKVKGIHKINTPW